MKEITINGIIDTDRNKAIWVSTLGDWEDNAMIDDFPDLPTYVLTPHNPQSQTMDKVGYFMPHYLMLIFFLLLQLWVSERPKTTGPINRNNQICFYFLTLWLFFWLASLD